MPQLSPDKFSTHLGTDIPPHKELSESINQSEKHFHLITQYPKQGMGTTPKFNKFGHNEMYFKSEESNEFDTEEIDTHKPRQMFYQTDAQGNLARPAGNTSKDAP